MISRLDLRHLGAALAALALVCAAPAHAQPITVTDVAGRTVTLPRPATRVILGEGRQLTALTLVHPDPTALVVGWLADLKRLDPATYGQYRRARPGIDAIAQVGITNEATFSIETALSLRPDIAIFSGGHGPSSRSSETVAKLTAAGIPSVFIDFHDRPLENTVPSIRLLGRLLGRDAQAEAFAVFYQQRIARIAQRLKAANIVRPKVMIHMHAVRRECCFAPGKGNLGEFVALAGGDNIGAKVLPGIVGQLNLEYVIAARPDVYVATSGSHVVGGGALAIGTGVEAETARRTLAEVVRQPGIDGLPAVKSGRVHGLWHHFYNSPLNILAVEAMAKWFHPDLFQDVDPEADLRELNEKFLPVPLQGTYWIDLAGPIDGPTR